MSTQKTNDGRGSSGQIAEQMQSKKRMRDIGMILTILGVLLGIGVNSISSDLTAMLFLIGIIGIVMWIVNSISYNKMKKSV
jgi:hypothetical protein